LGGTVGSTGGATLSARGVVYSRTADNSSPTIGGAGVTNVVAETTTTGAFTISATGLGQGTAYSFKAYATNSVGTAYTSVGTYGLYTAAQYAANYGSGQAAGRTAGQADVTSAPNSYGLYNLSQIQALNVGTPLLAKDSATGKFKLTVKAKKSTDLVNFSDMPFSAADAVINSKGEMEFQFTSPDNAAFFRIESR